MIELHGVRKLVGQEILLDVPAFSVPAGQCAVITAPPGNARETLFDLLSGRIQASQGKVSIAGFDPFKERSEFARRVGVLFLEDGLYKSFSVQENLLFHCRLRGLPRDSATQALASTGLADQAKTRFAQLSPGAARRLALGRAILHQPGDLLLVEPLARCDEASIQIICNLIRAQCSAGTSCLVIAAETARLSDLCETLYSLQNGNLVEIEQPGAGETAQRPFKIPVKLEGRVALVNPLDIWYAEADGDSACIQTADGRLPTQYTLSELEQRLGRSGFFRAHRAYLVNLQHVKEVIPFTRSSFSLRLDDPAGTLIPLSKAAAAELRSLLDY